MIPGYKEIKETYEKLPSYKFQSDAFCSYLNYNHFDFVNIDTTLKEGFSIIGWCEGSALMLRPRANSIGVLLLDETEGVEFWFHVYDCFDGE